MEFLTLQDVPHYHRSAMSFRDSSPPHHCAKPQEASERMQVGHVINPPSSPSSSLCTPTSDTHSLQTATASPSTPPSCEAPGDSRALVPVSHKPQDTPACRLYLVGNGWKAEVTAMRAMQDQAGVDALLAAAESQRAMADETLTVPAGEGQRVPAAGAFTLPLRPATQRTGDRRGPTQSPAEPERLTDIEPHPQGTANGLPPFKELARVADKPHEEQSVANVPSPTTIGYWQTSSARNSRQSSTERHMLNRPTTIEFSNPFGALSARLPSSPENYTTQNAGRPSFHHARSSPTREHRRSSARSRFEPRIPSLQSALVSLRKSSESGPLTTRPAGHHPSRAYAHQLPLPGSPPDIRRASEAQYSHHGYGSPYGNEHYTYRSSWVPEASSYQPRYQPRHDSTMAPYLDPRNPYSYQPPYPHNLEHGHHGMVDGTYTRRRRGNLPKEATLVLKKWFQAHAQSPYPTDEEKNQLAGVTGLTQSQISNWFINARRRNPGKEARDAAKRAAQQAREGREMDVDHDRNPAPRPQPQDGLQLQQDHSRRDNDRPGCEDREMNDS